MTPERHWMATMLMVGGLLTECSADPKAGPVAHWAMTEPAGATLLADSSGHGRTATLQGGVRTGDGACKNAASFPGRVGKRGKGQALFGIPLSRPTRAALNLNSACPFLSFSLPRRSTPRMKKSNRVWRQ